ncbi:unnamed protein product [Rotaria socialis]|uniref:ARMC9 CTLH-like domain-containing protein n=1 Tax=Rotaria socialis TaxID=392032 RepID=A0A817QUD2_9BILA|nr:unnamed protein product [Rotaria socialis]CAF3368649.1 unnamed protein product [Rotaria socialis]CAF3380182.1 unnamed protein product [Rotaria socialis]CAF3388941.1 unnamed protein product [Rotaria socialis]CAF4416968.1 unnamed protein product [Rotaria socialis]
MATSFTCINDLIREYFQYRNLTSTSRTFDNELSKLPFVQYRADLIIERLTIHIHQFEINNLIDYWTQIEQHLLSTLVIESQRLIDVFKKIRINLYRCYLMHAVQSSKMDKINEFFERLTKFLQQTNEWTKEWFTLPFIKNPEENSIFQVYFSKQWNELFWTSLQNFLSLAFYHMSQPLMCSMDEDNSQTFTDLINLQSTIPKPLILSSSNMNPSKISFAETFEDEQLSMTEQFPQSNVTIFSKLRSKFMPTMKQNQAATSQNQLQSLLTCSTTDDSIRS